MGPESTLIIIPTYNERENISPLIEQILAIVPNVDVLVVDDNSPDGTADGVMQVFEADPRCSVLRRKGPRGFGRSSVDGYRYALAREYARLVQMDADFSHDPRSLPELIDTSTSFDMVIGSRYCQGGGTRNWAWHRRLLSRFANRYVSLITGMKITDSTSGFRCYTRRALETILETPIDAEGYSIQVEVTHRAHRAGLRIAEVPIIFVERREGTSKMSWKVIFESIFVPWRLRFRPGMSWQGCHRGSSG